MSDLLETVAGLVAPGTGILAADESVATMSRRLVRAGVDATPANRRDYRALLLTTPGLGQWISGIIFCDETLGQSLVDGTPFPFAARERGIQPGIKVDTGVSPLPFTDGVTVTEGLDGLRDRLERFRAQGATFAKWRAVFNARVCATAGGRSAKDSGRRGIRANAHGLARYAALCQEAGLVPVVEPEVVMDGDHHISVCERATANVLAQVFAELDLMGVDARAIVLKPNMVVPGTQSEAPVLAAEVARRTLKTLRAHVPPAVPAIAFLSGGQRNDQACANLRAINELAAEEAAPWRLTFSFGRALVDDALATWRGDPDATAAAQAALAANCARAAAAHRYTPEPSPAVRP
ncbi:class I fructose-bisphosphate aldolase [Dactylosporangium sp. NPDC005572]|uniref:class I fructose-bisphosphate aldolase n=1 Tax=Dactylosporangium sp. NPDC005572 TaxID=3156889 RepID=UPI0033BB9488